VVTVRARLYFSMLLAGALICGSLCAPAHTQSPGDVGPIAGETPPADSPQVQMEGLPTDAPATVDGCQVIARVDGQVVLACEQLWQVNRMIEKSRVPVPDKQLPEVRDQLMKQQLANNLDTKLLYGQFLHNFPAENLPHIEENLQKPFEQQEMPRLMKILEVDSQKDLELKLCKLGSSLNDAKRSFNERVIAQEWVRSKVKINEEVSPVDMLEYYQSHLADYDFPATARWEELMVRADRFKSPSDAYAALCGMGNEVMRKLATNPVASAPIFADIAKAKSQGFTASDGGINDWTTKGALKDEAIDVALFSLPVGQMSPILKSDDGFHIIRVLERKDAGRKPFTDVQNKIRDQLKEERFHDGVEKYLAELHRDARIWTIYTGPIAAETLLASSPGATKKR
jgi:PPIC-type PPIASE domain